MSTKEFQTQKSFPFRFDRPWRLAFGITAIAIVLAAVGCKKPVVQALKPMSAAEIALPDNPPPPIKKRLYELSLLREDKITINKQPYRVLIPEKQVAHIVEGFSNVQLSDLEEFFKTKTTPHVGMFLKYDDDAVATEPGHSGDVDGGDDNVPAISTKNVFLDLDVLYVNSYGVIKDIRELNQLGQGLPARRFKEDIHFVVELLKGEAKRIGAKVGQKISIPQGLEYERPVSTPIPTEVGPVEGSDSATPNSVDSSGKK